MAIARHHRRGTLALLLAALTAAGATLAGCGTDAQSGTGSGGPVTIQIWDGYQSAEATAFSQLISEYEAAHPGVKISSLQNLFNSGKLGMLVTGPWDLSSFPNVDYGVQVMPSYPGSSAGHQTISGPDNWVVFNNGSGQVSAAEQFLTWLTAAPQVKYFSLQTGDLPTRASVAGAAGFDRDMDKQLTGVSTFIDNLSNVKQARPQIPQYSQVSTVLGNMIVSVLLGKSTPQAALAAAASQVNSDLAGS